ncbi:uncharacterized protein METZ01_LOCUS23681 [marine metagenome]|uniref:Uncharacterized protein n=1 Tax=marine metagenome TaxID=408172 RepID=A0A381PXV5_9ZZZZ
MVAKIIYFNYLGDSHMSITRDQINAAMTRFLDRGGSIRRYERVVGEPILGSDIWLTEDTLELIETHDSDFLG